MPSRGDELTVVRWESEGEACRLVHLEVPVDLPVFADHFPGSPILPAYVELGQIVRSAAAAWPDLGRWSGGRRLKFNAPVLPGAALQLRMVRRSDADWVDFTLRMDGQACSTGTLTFMHAEVIAS